MGSPDRYRELYAMLLDAIPSSVLLIDRDMRVVSANRNFSEKSRRPLADILGHRLEEVFPPVILDQMDISRRLRQVFEGHRPIAGERMTYRAPGIPLRIYYYSILPFSWEGEVKNAILLMEDITEQVRLSEEVRRVESRLASVVESARDIVLSTDTGGLILTWNTAAEKISGYHPEEVKGRAFFEFFVPEHQAGVKQAFAGMLADGHSRVGGWDLVKPEGERVSVSWVCSPMKDEQGQTVGIVAVGRDETQQRQLEMRLVQSQKLAALGVMAGGIAHEIRNPLAICSSAAQFLLEENPTPDFLHQCAEKIQGGIQKVSVIIENLLRFARPSERTEMTQVDLVRVISEPLHLVANQARLQKIAVVTQFPPGPTPVSGMESLLPQVFMNLFLNAIDAMPEGGTLTVTVKPGAEEVRVRVADTGHGISKEDIDNIFDPFYTKSPVGRGTGLGLSICYSIVKEHRGAIEVESETGRGATFTVRLPVA